MTMRKFTGFGLLMVLGFAATAFAYCPNEKHDHTPTAEQAKSAQPCPHASGGSVTTTANDAAKTEDKASGGCHKKGSETGLASEKSGGCAKQCPFNKFKTAEGQAPQSAVDAVLASLPSMKYRVGSETTCCAKTAEEISIKADRPIQYVVGEKAYENKMEATAALTKLLESEIATLTAVQFSVGGKSTGCPHEAQDLAKQNGTTVAYKVGGLECCDKEKAEKAVKLASDAVNTVKLSYKVGEATFCCDRMAGAKVKETGQKMTYVVGKEETCCEQSAKLLLAQAKIRAIVEAVAAGLSS